MHVITNKIHESYANSSISNKSPDKSNIHQNCLKKLSIASLLTRFSMQITLKNPNVTYNLYTLNPNRAGKKIRIRLKFIKFIPIGMGMSREN